MLPNYISNAFLTEVLQEYWKDKTVKIINVETKEAVPVGDNFTSDLYRSKITYKTVKNV